MRAITRRTTLLTTAAMALAIAVPSAMAQDDKFPSKTIEIVTHAKYGGGTDTTARMMMIRTRRELGVDMVVNSQQGGGGAAAIDYAMKKPKDGYTVLAMTQTHLYTIARGKAGVGIDDIVGIARAMDDPTFITVNAKGDIKSLDELIARSKEEPLNWGIAEIGNTELSA
ncbi:MAG: tripartite tricarboxylate transporter substrate-binding protein [Alphaproteobacteria bacterium]